MNGQIVVEGLNPESIDILNSAFRMSLQDNCVEATTLHLMVAALENMRIANQFTETTGVNADTVFNEYSVRIEEETDVSAEKDRIYIANVVISKDLDEILTKSSYIYRITGQLITPEMLIYLMIRQTNTPATRLLKCVHASVEESVGKFRLLADLSADSEEFNIEDVEEFDLSKKPVATTQDYFEAIHEDLIKAIFGNVMTQDKCEDCKDKIPYGLVNLTEKVYNGEIEPSINRDAEISDIIETLSKKKNANALLVGEPGVGKTAIAHGFVHRIETEDICDRFYETEVYELKVDRLVQGSGMRGELEARLNNIIDFIRKTDSILVIDEFQSLMKLGDMGGAVSPINILKPYLENGDINLIGMTTLSEYKKYVEGDTALCRRFKLIEVKEPSIADTITILSNSVDSYEDYHGCKISKEQIKLLVRLADRYITTRKLPDKAFAVLDEAMAIAKLKGAKNVTSKEIKQVVSKISGVPVTDMSKTEIERVSGLEKEFKKHIIGQDNAVEIVCKAIKRGKAGINDPNKPVASFLFVGPTGVGKTELCKVLSQNYSSSNERNTLIRLDMSEYSEKHSVSKLFGAPPGYVGYDEGGGLTEKVKHNPYSVILFDEIEKAHPEVFNSMLQVLDEGEMTDNKGNKVNFRNCIIVMTSNAGYGADTFGKRKIGINISDIDNANNDNEIKALKALEETFKPEFLNRIDNVVIFNKLTKEQSKRIVGITLNKLTERAKAKGIKIDFSDKVIELIVDKGYDEKYNARNLKRTVQNLIENKLANEIIDGNISNGSSVSVLTNDNNEVVLKVS